LERAQKKRGIRKQHRENHKRKRKTGENCSIIHMEGEGKNKQQNTLRSIRLD